MDTRVKPAYDQFTIDAAEGGSFGCRLSFAQIAS
jgi:hypothetical protein